ncbi:L-serine ammonia-lyase, iron-sulfur-dependent, subunit alpha, partial [Ruminococcaceae bacterium OttesenSCG-928-I18]|nr:L-serine ammonia-lyase, iron-sulfur-dependent, subunit alpha [Ruminococcaceae bacterium OttesenSCG-928-I18]
MYRSFEELFTEAESRDVPLWQVILENEMLVSEKTKEQVFEELEDRWAVMSAAAVRALYESQKQDHALVEGLAMKQQAHSKLRSITGEGLNHMMAMAFSASEVNASMGRVCAAPTAGSSGVLPAVLLSVIEGLHVSDQQLMEALLVAGGVGAIITRNATVAGAEGGCQAECGAAAAMAAAAVVTLADGSPRMVGEAVSIAFMNCMGLVCDPVAGQVQLPCYYRNASQAVNAVISADMAMAGQKAAIPPDEVVEAMYKTGKRMAPELRETAAGGIAATPTAMKYTRKLQE